MKFIETENGYFIPVARIIWLQKVDSSEISSFRVEIYTEGGNTFKAKLSAQQFAMLTGTEGSRSGGADD